MIGHSFKPADRPATRMPWLHLILWGGILALPLPAESAPADESKPVKLSPLVVSALPDLQTAGTGGTAALGSVTPLKPGDQRLSDLFQQVPGLLVQDSFGGFDPPRLAVRGSGIQSAPTSRGLWISFLGMPLNSADGSFNLSLLESSWLASADLICGPAAGVPALGGALMLGGAEDAFTRGNSVSASYGSWDTASFSANVERTGDDYALAARAAYDHGDGWRPHSEQDRECLFAAARSALNDDTDLTIQFFSSHPRYEVPGPLTEQNALDDPTSPVAAVVRDQPRRDTEYAQLSARLTKRWTKGRMSVALGGVNNNDEFYQLLANGISSTNAQEAYLAFNAEQAWNTAGQHTSFSALLQSGWWDASRWRNVRGNKGALIGEEQLRPFTLTAAIDHRIKLTESQQLEIGASVLSARRDIDDRYHPKGAPAVDLSMSDTRFAPRAAWSWKPVEEATVVVSWARSYEPPTYNDLLYTAGPANARVLRSSPLDWQSADSYEIGAHGRHERLSWSSNVYYSPWRSEFLRLVDANGSARGTVNAKRTLHTGWESSAAWDILADSGNRLTFWTTYNYTNARFDNDPVYGNGRLAGVPPHIGAVGLSAVTSNGWFVTPDFQWRAGETYGDHAHDTGYGGTGLCSLELGRHHPDGWSITLGIHNLFDRRAIASTAGVLDRAPDPANTAIFLPATGRSVDLRFDYHW